MTTRGVFRARLRETLADETQWPDAVLNSWLNDAIRDYSYSFPRQASVTIACVAAQREYALTSYTDLLGVRQVEYPDGEDPPRFLQRRPETGNFVDLQVYDLRGDPPVTLVIGEEPSAGENIVLLYTAAHTIPGADSTALTVPEHHLDALKLFVVWQAVKELELAEAADPDKTTLLLNMLGLNSYRAERSYRTKLEDYRKQAAPGGYAGPWVMDDYDRVY